MPVCLCVSASTDFVTLPGIFLSKVCSLCNKLDELHLLVGKKKIFIFCFMLHGDVAVWIDTRLCAAAGRLHILQSRLPFPKL